MEIKKKIINIFYYYHNNKIKMFKNKIKIFYNIYLIKFL